ncbi:MAG: metallophosphoesterase family protein [Clostridia bacterium]|nr:metallophosphoesterase family protein [Clostridia bacterium]
MKLAALGDIHGNYTALEMCLAWAEDNGVTHLAFLGDYITDCPHPQRVMKLLYEASDRFETVFVRGNREEYMIGLAQAETPIPAFYGSRRGNIYATYEQLTQKDIAFFDAMPTSTVCAFAGLPLRLCHGAPYNTRTVVRPGYPAMAETLSALTEPYLLCAHSHLAFVYRDAGTGKTVINGGSVGHPCRDTTINAEFAVLDGERGSWCPELISLPYDIAAAVRDFEDGDFLQKANVWARAVRATLLTGHNMTAAVLRAVAALKAARGLPEEMSAEEEEPLWEQAAEQLQI